MEIRITREDGRSGIALWAALDGNVEQVLAIPHPMTLEILHDVAKPDAGQSRIAVGYDEIRTVDGTVVGLAHLTEAGCEYCLEDRWHVADSSSVRLARRLEMRAAAGARPGVRLLVESEIAMSGSPKFRDITFFAPPALYDMNDIDGDGIEDYLDTRELVYRDDRLTAMAVLAYLGSRKAGIALTREDIPEFDDIPQREIGQADFAQRTDIGGLGLMPGPAEEARLLATYPFVERARSHARTAKGREPWGAFWPCAEGTAIEGTWAMQVVRGASAIDALWELWKRRVEHLSPRRVQLRETLDDIARLRFEAMIPFYAELPGKTPLPAGFVTNCHPQDGKQLANVLQYGFTGLMLLNAYHVLSRAAELRDQALRGKGLRVIDFFVQRVQASKVGLIGTLYNMDTGRPSSWWHGLLLPLAYAEAGADLEQHMGPIYEHMRYAVDAMKGVDGTYFRCMCEEQYALLLAYEAERAREHDHHEWLAAARRFGEFLLASQEPDGTWRRAYTLEGKAITEPRKWFGETDLHQKAVTSTAIPVLVQLWQITGERRWLDAAAKAGEFVAERYIRGLKWNGALHDSIYSRAQLVDSEGIQFALRAMLALAKELRSKYFSAAALDAARLLCTWIYLWDVPLPPSSTLARFGFRSTGWGAVDTCGIGFIDSRRLDEVPNLFEVAVEHRDELVARMTELTLHASNEAVATPSCSWGYARNGLQQEGLLVSWWVIDDPMFLGTGFGGHGKGEGNKTCLAWISAIALYAHSELLKRFGTTDLRSYWSQHVAVPSGWQ